MLKEYNCGITSQKIISISIQFIPKFCDKRVLFLISTWKFIYMYINTIVKHL